MACCCAAVLYSFLCFSDEHFDIGPPVMTGGWLRMWDLNRQITKVQSHDDGLKQCNSKLQCEVRDLKTGDGPVEERVCFELGMNS